MLGSSKCTCKIIFPIRRYSTPRISNLVLDEAYVPSKVEIQSKDASFFTPPIVPEHFSLILPPPNITGKLHLGHALTGTIQDILVRWNQMHGVKTLWVPGFDHAGIATQMVVEKQILKKMGKSRHELGRHKFNEEVLHWKSNYTSIIDSQLRRLGLSLDWNRQFFTMDSAHEKIVSEVFVKLFDKGLIYRNESLVNWSCFLRSAISDVEVNHLDIDGKTEITVPGYGKPITFGRIYSFSYKMCDSDDEIIVSTTRPETILGDVAVAVHPNDDRYTKLIGRKVYHPFRNKEIPIIADEFVDMNFGSGSVKITPAHNHTDFAIAQKHSLECVQVINEEGKMVTSFKDFDNVPRLEVRELILHRLKCLGLLKDIREHKMTIPICSRSGDIVEFLLKPQWFMKCSEMAQRAVEDVRQGRLVIEPKNFEDKWFDWLENIRDWCISRQLWWGHRIPVYLCRVGTQQEWIAGAQMELVRNKASDRLKVPDDRIHIEQDDDVLDTWFSSALLPFSVFSGPNSEADLSKFYPLSLLETGHDILFFWVARMVMMCTELTGKLPFQKILLHGIICDSQGRKMSKSLGNVISPENVIDGISLQGLNEVARSSEKAGILTSEEFRRTLQEQTKMFPEGIPECGIDALRYTLVSHNVKNHFINFDVQECYSNKLFCNKIWQATKFTRLWFEKVSEVQNLTDLTPILGRMDKWILSRYCCLIDILTKSIPECDLHVATLALKRFLYNDLCDVYLETTKRGLRYIESETAAAHCWTLVTVLDGGLRALHPFMPYVTKHLHQRLPSLGALNLSYPKETAWRDEDLETIVDDVLETVRGIRRLRRIFNINKKHKSKVDILVPNIEYFKFENTIKDLTRCDSINFLREIEDIVQEDGFFSVKDSLSNNVVIHMSIPPELRNSLKMEQSKLEKQKQKLVRDLDKMNDMMSGSTYNVNVTVEMKHTHQKRVALLKEKISRIDFIVSIL